MKEMPEFNQARIFVASDIEYIKKQNSTVLLFKHDIAEVILRLLPPNLSHSFLLIWTQSPKNRQKRVESQF
jgi:hypothetical protein